MQSHCIRKAILAGALVACIGSPALAQAPAPVEGQGKPAAGTPPLSLSASLGGMARAEFEAAKILYGVGDWANAIIKFKHAHDIAGDPRLLWNIAACEKNLLHYARALTAMERYRSEGGERITDQDRNDAQAIIDALKPLISKLKVLVSEPGATVYLDDANVGTSPLTTTVATDVGKHTLRVEKTGFKTFLESHQVEGGSAVTLVARLEMDVHRGQVVIDAGPKDLISLDGKVVAQGRFEGTLSSGGHALRITAPGMTTHQSEVLIQDNKTRRLQITLSPGPRPSDTATWVWLASGAAVLAGGVISGALLFKPAEAPQVQGTLGNTVPLSFRGW